MSVQSIHRRPLLVGEVNPYGVDPKYALYPYPERSAGGRLCRIIMGLEPREYLRRFERVNLCVGKWATAYARHSAVSFHQEFKGHTFVLLGSKVCGGVPFDPFTLIDRPGDLHREGFRAVILPHPSGLCRIWNEPDAVNRARRALYEVGITFVAPAA